MGHQVTIGGERLGSGKKMKAYLHGYERSTHDESLLWKSTMAPGTLVPCLTKIALPGTTMDIQLNAKVDTHPTIGPCYGKYKLEVDVFGIPIRLYQGKLHMNMLGIGMDMSKVPLPQMQLGGNGIDPELPIDNQHVNPSCILSYLGIRGVGVDSLLIANDVQRWFNAVPLLGYWDIYKNYYANKQEEIGYVIHRPANADPIIFSSAALQNSVPPIAIPTPPVDPIVYTPAQVTTDTQVSLYSADLYEGMDIGLIEFYLKINGEELVLSADKLFKNWTVYPEISTLIGEVSTKLIRWQNVEWGAVGYGSETGKIPTDTPPRLQDFPLANIDQMRMNLLSHFADTPYEIGNSSIAPYGLVFDTDASDTFSCLYNQEGLGIKTYNSDLFNNWLSTEWIDGVDGISAITAIDTSGGSFTIDELNLSKKIYNMLNRIAISGGTYDDWQDAVYEHDREKAPESPIYLGGLIKDIVFEEIVSYTATADQPLGTLAGRGTVGREHIGGNITVKASEPMYVMAIASITPYVDYSQGNQWDVNLKTMNDFHKPALDEIGYQDLVTDQMAWFDTTIVTATEEVIFKSAGKQPAWINYMTSINIVRGNFADENQQMFMTLNRRYDVEYGSGVSIRDLTTYIDPTKFNFIFADTRLDAQNFWVQIGMSIESRRKMSAKVIPNL